MRKVIDKGMYRIIDANFNRAKEGLRVCEDTCRFFYNNRVVTKKYKDIRHELTKIISRLDILRIIEARDIKRDVGKRSTASESKRAKVDDVFYANSQRTKESLRVLEEFIKLVDRSAAENLKKLRYKVYSLEKGIAKKINVR